MLEIFNATSTPGTLGVLTSACSCTRARHTADMDRCVLGVSYDDSKGRSLASKDIRPRDSTLSLSLDNGKKEKEEGVGRANSPRPFERALSLFLLRRLSRAHTFSRILRFSIVSTTSVQFEPRVRVQPRERKPVRSAWLDDASSLPQSLRRRCGRYRC